MSLRINHNIASINGHRNMLKNDMAISKSLEKLSSGLKINRAADDAAGLIISEQMRAQIAGLNQAVDNTETAVAMVQTAEGALDEMNTLLNKARELAIHAANDGANDATQLAADQSELDNIVNSITRIANNTQFGTKKILDGTLEAKSDVTVAGGTLANTNLDAVVSDMTGVKHLDAGTYTTHLTRVAAAGTVAQAAVTNQTAAFTGGALTGSTAAASLAHDTQLAAGDYQVALRNSSGNVFLSTFTATHTATESNVAASGSMTINGVATGAATLNGTDVIANNLTNVTNETTSLNGTTITFDTAGSVAGSAITSANILNTGNTYNLRVTNGTTTYEITGGVAGDDTLTVGGVGGLVEQFNTANSANVTINWSGAGAPQITFPGTGAQAGAAGDGFWVEITDGVNTASASADPTTTGAGVGGAKSYTVELVDASNAVRGTYTTSVAQGASTTMNDLLTAFATSATLSGDVTDIASASMDSDGEFAFTFTVDGGASANGYRMRVTSGSDTILSNASTTSAADDTLATMLTQFDADLTGGGIAADTAIDASGLDLAINAGLATGDASNGYSLRLTNLTTNAVVDSVSTAGGSDGTEVTAQVELRNGSGQVAAVLTGTAGANRATVTNSEVGITIDLDDTYATNVASLNSAVGVSFAYADDADNPGAVFQIGANRDQTVAISIDSAKATDLGRNGTNITDPAATLDSLRSGSYLTSGLAQEAISIIDKAIDDITNLRGELGAVQSNSLESNLSSLRATLENTTAAESVIRDVDFAAESAMFTRNSILIQASTAMLAQANQLPQNVLQLLG